MIMLNRNDQQNERFTAYDWNGVVEQLYPDYLRMANHMLRFALPLLEPGDLVGEMAVRLLSHEPSFVLDHTLGRRDYLAYGAKVMRNILIDYARRQGIRSKREMSLEGNQELLDSISNPLSLPTEELLAISQAVDDLYRIRGSAACIVELRFFAGLTMSEIAALLCVSLSKVNRDLQFARYFLLNVLQRKEAPINQHLSRD